MADDLFNVAGKVALVTGGTSGIGRMIAEGYAERGVRTYITGRDFDRLQGIAADLSASTGGTCLPLVADLADPEGPARLVEAFGEREGKLDILVNNAGTGGNGPIETVDIPDWNAAMEVNLRAPFFLVQQALPLLRAAAAPGTYASVINLGSIGGLHVPNWEAHAYGASKAALHHLTRSLAKRLGRDGIRVNAIAPGPFHSRMTDTTSEAVKASVAAHIPLGRPGEADDVKGLCLFLASRAGAYVHGSTIALDGGYIAAL
ncbi:SDR-family protein [Sphingobium sp. SYK-6]|nr:SDR-family protein [Sphingobium sp. SYK-6]